MKFNERREFVYDPEVFRRSDVQTALRLHHEGVTHHAGRPYPRFFEVDRSAAAIDPLWHTPVGSQVQFRRTLDVPCIVKFDKKSWALGRLGRQVAQAYRFWTSNIALSTLDYFATPGDIVYHSGYRLQVTSVDFEPRSYWQQTGVWLGIVFVAEIAPDGDVRPPVNPGVVAPAEHRLGEIEATKTMTPGALPIPLPQPHIPT